MRMLASQASGKYQYYTPTKMFAFVFELESFAVSLFSCDFRQGSKFSQLHQRPEKFLLFVLKTDWNTRPSPRPLRQVSGEAASFDSLVRP